MEAYCIASGNIAVGILEHEMPTPDELKQRIEAAIPGAVAEVTSADNVHFAARVSAEAFAGKSRIEQHRLVYGAFAPGELGGAVHALQLKTEVPTR
jgi:stress-induced morphogen